MRRLLPIVLLLAFAATPVRADTTWTLSDVTLGVGGATLTGVFDYNVYGYLETWDITDSGFSNIEFTSATPLPAGVSFTDASDFTVTDGVGHGPRHGVGAWSVGGGGTDRPAGRHRQVG